MRYDRVNHRHGERRLPWLPFCALVALTGTLAWSGCSYPEVGHSAYAMAVALDQAIERQSPEQLERAGEIIDQQLDSGAITDQEHRLLGEIIATAQQGDWSAAKRQTRGLLQDQVDW